MMKIVGGIETVPTIEGLIGQHAFLFVPPHIANQDDAQPVAHISHAYLAESKFEELSAQGLVPDGEQVEEITNETQASKYQLPIYKALNIFLFANKGLRDYVCSRVGENELLYSADVTAYKRRKVAEKHSFSVDDGWVAVELNQDNSVANEIPNSSPQLAAEEA